MSPAPTVAMPRADLSPRLCCFLHGNDIDRRCPQPARFYVYSPPWTYDDYTEACGDHVEDLKCTAADVVERIAPTP